ncbi:MAG: hypothetical protein IPM14_02470 [bacterium]|nr:hypothetical protein [bacterium]
MKKLFVCLVVSVVTVNVYSAIYPGYINNSNTIEVEQVIISDNDYSNYQVEQFDLKSNIEEVVTEVNNETDVQNEDELIDNSASAMGIGIF